MTRVRALGAASVPQLMFLLLYWHIGRIFPILEHADWGALLLSVLVAAFCSLPAFTNSVPLCYSMQKSSHWRAMWVASRSLESLLLRFSRAMVPCGRRTNTSHSSCGG